MWGIRGTEACQILGLPVQVWWQKCISVLQKYKKGESNAVTFQVLQSHSSFAFLSRISIALLRITNKNSSECYIFTFCKSPILTKMTIPLLDPHLKIWGWVLSTHRCTSQFIKQFTWMASTSLNAVIQIHAFWLRVRVQEQSFPDEYITIDFNKFLWEKLFLQWSLICSRVTDLKILQKDSNIFNWSRTVKGT